MTRTVGFFVHEAQGRQLYDDLLRSARAAVAELNWDDEPEDETPAATLTVVA